MWPEYVAEREAAVATRRRTQGVVDRLRQLAAAYDAEHLAVCTGCASFVPRERGLGDRRECPRCGARLVAPAEGRRVPTTAESTAVVRAAVARRVPPEATA